jgi:hypothetical protein
MNVRVFAALFSVALLLAQVASAQQRNSPPPPAPGDEIRSPSDQPPTLNGRTTRGYAPGQGPMKQAPLPAPAQAPSKQAPSAQAPMQAPTQAPSKGTAMYGDQVHTVGYRGDLNCAGCQPSYVGSQPSYGTSGGCSGRRGLFGRRRGC